LDDNENGAFHTKPDENAFGFMYLHREKCPQYQYLPPVKQYPANWLSYKQKKAQRGGYEWRPCFLLSEKKVPLQHQLSQC
jgi:hypothetical protein